MLHRGRAVTTDEVLRGYLFEDEKNSYILVSDNTPVPRSGSRHGAIRYYLVDKNSVGAFTGMTDKNGKMVFQKDFVRWEEVIYQVFFQDGAFGIEKDKAFIPLMNLRKPVTAEGPDGEEIILCYDIFFEMVPEKEIIG